MDIGAPNIPHMSVKYATLVLLEVRILFSFDSISWEDNKIVVEVSCYLFISIYLFAIKAADKCRHNTENSTKHVHIKEKKE